MKHVSSHLQRQNDDDIISLREFHKQLVAAGIKINYDTLRKNVREIIKALNLKI